MHTEPRHYETTFIMTPVLSDVQQQETVDKFRDLLQAHKVKMVHEDKLGLKRLAYPIQRHATGIYHLFEFKATPDVVAILEVAYKREDRVLRFLTFALEKHGVVYNEKKRSGVWNKKEGAHNKSEAAA